MKRNRIAPPGEVVDPFIYEEAIRKGLKEMFPKSVMAKKKSNFSPSKVGFGSGRCPRYWYYHFEGGVESIENGNYQSMMKRILGTDAHDRLQKFMGEDSGWTFELAVVSDDPPIYGYVDVYDPNNNVPVEIKNVDHAKFLMAKENNLGDESHIIQVLIYMKLKGATQGVLLYADRSTGELHAFSVIATDVHKKYINGLFEWMRMVRQAYMDQQKPVRPEGYSEKSFPCTYCPFAKHCWSDEDDGSIELMSAKGLPYK